MLSRAPAQSMESSKRRTVWSAEAEDDLPSIWQYGAREWSHEVADEHERILWRACERLLEHQELGSRDSAQFLSILMSCSIRYLRARSKSFAWCISGKM